MSKLSKEQVEKIARLARMELTEEEKEKFSGQLTEILKYVEKLQKVDTRKVKGTSQVTGLENVYRTDEAIGLSKVDKNPEKNRQKLLSNAPSQKDGYIKVRAVLE